MSNPPDGASLALTKRQIQMVELIALGYSNEEIGLRLCISPRTVKGHCDVLRRKLGVPRRRQIPAAFKSLTGDDPFSLNVTPGHFSEGSA